ncbi:MAG TPA: hypothetical protein VMX35_08950 [Acidobacteriota bacterium]|nr:hypothetical protein [Acidobacteriota bacterium]
MGNLIINQGNLQSPETVGREKTSTPEQRYSRAQQSGGARGVAVENLLGGREGVQVSLSAEAGRAALAAAAQESSAAQGTAGEQDSIFSVQRAEADVEPGSVINILI